MLTAAADYWRRLHYLQAGRYSADGGAGSVRMVGRCWTPGRLRRSCSGGTAAAVPASQPVRPTGSGQFGACRTALHSLQRACLARGPLYVRSCWHRISLLDAPRAAKHSRTGRVLAQHGFLAPSPWHNPLASAQRACRDGAKRSVRSPWPAGALPGALPASAALDVAALNVDARPLSALPCAEQTKYKGYDVTSSGRFRVRVHFRDADGDTRRPTFGSFDTEEEAGRWARWLRGSLPDRAHAGRLALDRQAAVAMPLTPPAPHLLVHIQRVQRGADHHRQAAGESWPRRPRWRHWGLHRAAVAPGLAPLAGGKGAAAAGRPTGEQDGHARSP